MSHCQCQSCCSSQSGCGCHSNSCSCGFHPCSCSCHSKWSGSKQSCCDSSAKFLELADHAWMELLKEKIKEHIQSQATHIDELARLISQANHERWKKKMEDKQCCGNFEEQLKSFFHQTCQTQGQKNPNPQGNSNKQR